MKRDDMMSRSLLIARLGCTFCILQVSYRLGFSCPDIEIDITDLEFLAAFSSTSCVLFLYINAKLPIRILL